MKRILKIDNEDFLEVEYQTPGGFLVSIKFIESSSAIQRAFFLKELAVNSSYKELENIAKIIADKSRKVEIVEVPSDLSFNVFWDAYAYKVGKKARSEKKWDSMNEGDKVKALAHIKKYNYFLSQRPTVEKKYPETFLNCEEWNN